MTSKATAPPEPSAYQQWKSADKARRQAANAYTIARAALEEAEANAARLRRAATEAVLADPLPGDLLNDAGSSWVIVTRRDGAKVACAHGPSPIRLPEEGATWEGAVGEFGKRWGQMMLTERNE